MRKSVCNLLVLLLVLSLSVTVSTKEYNPADSFSTTEPFVLFDYDARTPMSSVNGLSGIFDFDPNDAEAYCRTGYVRDEGLHKDGYHMKVSYDVDSVKPAFNGWWTKLNGINLSDFEAVALTIKGDSEKGFSDIFKIELKDRTTKVEYIVEDITDKWQQIIVPFDEFEGALDSMDWSTMNEFVIVFEDWRLKTKEGRYYIDDISFVPKKGAKVKFSDLTERKK
mgnify:FL=1